MPGGYEWLIIIAVLLLLFGAKKLPEMARSVGQSARVFKGEMKGLKDDEAKSTTTQESRTTPQELPSVTPAPQTEGDPVPQAQDRQPQDRGTANPS
ncbi:Sec-independent protein translocase subunit TatA [Pseudonocardia parietis]|uniref:Sec-independent protein translocase protein TatA n=1 Tax=Pseudonocardia parietis TaxID=570936 RepID=A0ABS4VWK3_9PSEU|nr:Sec-independent protein translocase subunit TatA [Pseudonocardia parietis]MBP2368308.1 sec-independent protein translocase protein TatA [Pseudonocardia parietis]